MLARELLFQPSVQTETSSSVLLNAFLKLPELKAVGNQNSRRQELKISHNSIINPVPVLPVLLLTWLHSRVNSLHNSFGTQGGPHSSHQLEVSLLWWQTLGFKLIWSSGGLYALYIHQVEFRSTSSSKTKQELKALKNKNKDLKMHKQSKSKKNLRKASMATLNWALP